MSLRKSISAILLSLVLLGGTTPARAGDDELQGRKTKHVLLISIDGMHAVDYENCVAANTCPNLAALGKTGVNYTRTTTSRPSDSFPGLMALVSGGRPPTVGAVFDGAHHRVLGPPKNSTGNRPPGGTRHAKPNKGKQNQNKERKQNNQTKLNGGFAGYSTIDGGVKSIDPNKLIRDPFNNCKPVYSWNFVRTNTIFGVIHASGGYTAWADKHAAYASVSGPTGTDQPSNVDDYYSPEVNSLQIVLPGLKTAALTPQASFDCGTLVPNGDDWTTDFDAIKCYDQLKVNAVLNQIRGRTHLGTNKAPVPVIFGMNFQAVSVGEKLIEPKSAVRTDANSGGYEDAQGTPRPKMLAEIQFVDAAIGQMVEALKHGSLLDSTTVIITAKHGQSPIDPNRFFPIPGNSGNNGTPPSGIIGSFLPAVYSDPNNGLGLAEDDISPIWLADSSRPADALTALVYAAEPIGLGQIYYGSSINTLFNSPGVPNNPC